jgi:hypothetical protein
MPIELLKDAQFLRACKENSVKTLKNIVPEKDLEQLLRHLPDPSREASNARSAGGLGVPSPIGANVNFALAFVYGTITCDPSGQPWQYSATVWGFGLAGFGSTGFLYTACDSWDAFFRSAAGYHAQGGGAAAGVVQATWFNGSGVPIGQYNGVGGGLGVFEAGGKGGWTHK